MDKQLLSEKYFHISNSGIVARIYRTPSEKFDSKFSLDVKLSAFGIGSSMSIDLENSEFCRELASMLLNTADQIDNEHASGKQGHSPMRPCRTECWSSKQIALDFPYEVRIIVNYENDDSNFTLDNVKNSPISDVIEWLETQDLGAWIADIEHEFQGPFYLVVKFVDHDDATLYKITWQ